MNSTTEGTFPGADGLALFYRAWLPPDPPRAVLLFVHGHGEHCGRYGGVVDALVPRGFAVYGFDLRGHGLSPGMRGHINAWREYREDVAACLARIHADLPGAPVFLWGYSLGALIALEYAIHAPDKLRGLIVMGAPFQPTGVAKPHLVLLAKALSFVLPAYQIRLGLSVGKATHDPAVAQAGLKDPLMHPWATARWGTACMKAVDFILAHPAEVRLPLLILHGEADPYNAVAGARAYFERVTFPDKTLLTYPEAAHELHNDLGREQVIADMGAWMLARVGAA